MSGAMEKSGPTSLSSGKSKNVTDPSPGLTMIRLNIAFSGKNYIYKKNISFRKPVYCYRRWKFCDEIFCPPKTVDRLSKAHVFY